MSLETISEKFGELTFNDEVMREKLPKSVYKQLRATIDSGQPLDRRVADTIAHGIKEWAMEHGATHYCHWFQPLTGSTAEKHDAFLDFEDGVAMERFTGNQLVQGEPDASSFPSGGIRSTFEARGYTAWDPSSPIFILKSEKASIMAIPSIFVSYTGEALDAKTPLLRSMRVINEACKEALALFGREVEWVKPTLGCEQEYFLIPKDYYDSRIDLRLTDRTVLGAPSPKDQQLDDHYFGQVPYPVRDFMEDMDDELYRLGIPAKTRHNEVAPCQYEIACIYQFTNKAVDQNQLLMQVVEETAREHGLEAVFHEKPFAGINGSGKHNNWSLQDSEGNNLLEPTDNPRENLPFLFFVTAVMQGVHRYEALIRSSVATIGNDHRLGANEAPPAIVSVFLGKDISDIIDEVSKGKFGAHKEQGDIDHGVDEIFDIEKDNTDRNRTSPFAFTGNKFEFRAVGGSQNVSLPQTFINLVVADAVQELVGEVKSRLDKGLGMEKALLDVMQKSVKDSTNIRFLGDNYSEEWVQEAEKRGLSNNRKTPEALKIWEDDKYVNLFTKHKVLSREELHARYHIELENYSTKLQIEANTLVRMVETSVLPAALDYQREAASALKAAYDLKESIGISADDLGEQGELVKSVVGLVASQRKSLASLKGALEKAHSLEDPYEHASHCAHEVSDAMLAVREAADQLEAIVDESCWRIPNYTDLLHSIS